MMGGAMEASVWILALSLAVVSSSPRYVLHLSPSSFDEANRKCLPGTLTSLWSEEEVDAVLASLSDSEQMVWVGLRKDRTSCVDPALPLRGFRWTAGGGPQSMVSRWGAEPKATCTGLLCAALRIHRTGPEPDWSLNPVSCRHAHPFICKIPEDGTSTGTGTAPEPGPTSGPLIEPGPTPGPSTEPEPTPGPATEPGPLTEPGPIPGPTPGPATGPEPSTPASESTSFGPSVSKPPAEPEPSKPAADPKPSEPYSPEAPSRDPCRRPVVPGSRFLSLDPEDPGRVLVECWSSMRVELFCGGQPMTLRFQNGSEAQLSTVCSGCSPGFQRAASGQCEDVDECVSGPCGTRTCVNTHGTFHCVCDGHHGNSSCDSTETQDQLTGFTILVPILVATAALVVLVIVVVVTVICCRRRRSLKKRANEEY